MLPFKNVLVYKITKEINLAPNYLEEELSKLPLLPCQAHEINKIGWVNPLGLESELKTHVIADKIFIKLGQEKKIVPSSVLRKEFDEYLEKHEEKLGHPVTKEEKSAILDAVHNSLIQRAFSQFKYMHAVIIPSQNLILVEASGSNVAEMLLGLLRKSLGSLPVSPISLDNKKISSLMTAWLIDDELGLPEALRLNGDAEIKDDEGGVTRYKNQDLEDAEIVDFVHGQRVTKLSLNWRDKIDFIICDNFSLKQIRFSNLLFADAYGGMEDLAGITDADFAIVSGELDNLLSDLFKWFSVGDINE